MSCRPALCQALALALLALATLPSALLLLPSVPQHPSATASPLPLPLAHLSSVLSATDEEPEEGEVPLTPPIHMCLVSTRHQKFAYAVFVPWENPGIEHPPGIDSPQKFSNQKSGRVAGGV